MKIAIRNPRDDKEMLAIMKMFGICFPKLSSKYFIKRILGDPDYRRQDTWLLTENDRIVSHVQVFRKKVWRKGRLAKMLGLGFICTLPEFRNKGYASMIIRGVLKKNKGTLCVLFTKIPRYYERLGFSVVKRSSFSLTRMGWHFRAQKRGRIRRFDMSRDISKVMKLHESYFSALAGVVKRGIKDWQSQMAYFNEDKELFLVLFEKEELKAYVRCKRYIDHSCNDKVVSLVEYASSQGKLDLGLFIDHLFRHTDCDRVCGQGIFLDEGLKRHCRLKESLDSSMMWANAGGAEDEMNAAFLEADGF